MCDHLLQQPAPISYHQFTLVNYYLLKANIDTFWDDRSEIFYSNCKKALISDHALEKGLTSTSACKESAVR